MAKIDYKDIKTGDSIPALVKSAIDRVQISQFAAAANDFNPMHVDEMLAKANGYHGVCAHSQLASSYIEEMLRKFADNMKIFNIEVTFHKLIWPGDALTSKGVVSKLYEEDGQFKMDIELWTENQNQDVVLKGTAVCVLESDS
jgi:acyl dehydratase